MVTYGLEALAKKRWKACYKETNTVVVKGWQALLESVGKE